QPAPWKAAMAHIDLIANDAVPTASRRVVKQGARATFNIDGMRCANCASSVEKAIRAVGGVSQVAVNAATAKAFVEWDPHRTTLKAIFEAVSRSEFIPVALEG